MINKAVKSIVYDATLSRMIVTFGDDSTHSLRPEELWARTSWMPEKPVTLDTIVGRTLDAA